MYADHVICNFCGQESFVERDSDICPSCKTEGCLMDIEQDMLIDEHELGLHNK